MNKKLALFTTLGLCTACVGSAFAISNINKVIKRAEGNTYSVTFDATSRYQALGYFYSDSTRGTEFLLYAINCTGDSDEYLTVLRSSGSGFEIANDFQHVNSIVIDFEGAENISVFFDKKDDGQYDNERRSSAYSGVECTPSDASYGEDCTIRVWVSGYDVQINSITVNYTCE